MSEEKVIQDIVRRIKLSDEVRSIDFSFSEDSTGMPAVWINLHVAEDNNPSAEKISRYLALRKSITQKVFEQNILSWPYVRLVTDA